MCTLEQAYGFESWNSGLCCALSFSASTTVNVTHQPMAPAVPKLPIPRTPSKHQVVYTTIPAPPAQTPVRGAVMTSPGLRPVTPQTGGRGWFLPCASYRDTAWYVPPDGCGILFFDLGLLFGLFTILVLVREVRGFFSPAYRLEKILRLVRNSTCSYVNEEKLDLSHPRH